MAILRFYAENIGDTMCLVSRSSGCLADGVYKSYTLKPLVVGQLNFADKVMEMPDEAAHDKTRPVWHIGSNSIDDGVSEVGIEAVGAILLHVWGLLCVGVHLECLETRQKGYREMSKVNAV